MNKIIIKIVEKQIKFFRHSPRYNRGQVGFDVPCVTLLDVSFCVCVSSCAKLNLKLTKKNNKVAFKPKVFRPTVGLAPELGEALALVDVGI